MNTMSMPSTDTPHVIVVGGGAAGMMAAGTALSLGARVTLFEGNERLGRKLAITGKGRCNVTNNCSPREVLENVITNPRFLFAAMAALPPEDTMALFEGLGVPLKTERGRRVFPVSDRAYDIVDALARHCAGADIRHTRVKSILAADGAVRGVLTAAGESVTADSVILATGGASYPLTGSDGAGHRMAAALGHTVTPLRPSLVPLCSPDAACGEMMGLSLKNVVLRILPAEGGRPLFEEMGEMLFAHFGISGPLVLSASAHMQTRDPATLVAEIDLKPALDEATLDARLRADFSKYANRDFGNSLGDLLPAKMIPVILRRTGIPPEKKVHSVTREERRTLLCTLKHFRLPLSGFRPLAEAIVTAGGIDVREVNPKTMMSRSVCGLFFAGEILDVDAYTGGYNLQIAFATGYLAGTHAATYFKED